MAEQSQKFQDLTEMSISRIRRALEKYYVNPKVSEQIEYHKEKIEKYNATCKQLETTKPKLNENGTPELDENGNPVMEPLSEAKAKELATFKSKNQHSYSEHKEYFSALSGAKTKFSGPVPFLLAVVSEEVTKELLQFGMDNCIAAKKKTLKVEYLHKPGVENLNVYPLIKSLPSWLNPPAEPVVVRKKHSETQETATETTGEKKKTKKAKKTEENGVSEKSPEEQASTPEKKPKQKPAKKEAAKTEDNKDSEITLTHYISRICKNITNPPKLKDNGTVLKRTVEGKSGNSEEVIVREENSPYKDIKGSKHVKKYINTLLFELLGRLMPLVCEHLAVSETKTINENAVIFILKLLVVDGCETRENVSYDTEEKDDPKVLEEERKKRKELKEKYEKPATKPNKVKVFVAKSAIKFLSAKWDALYQLITSKLSEFKRIRDELKEKKEQQKKEKQSSTDKSSTDKSSVDKTSAETPAKDAEAAPANQPLRRRGPTASATSAANTPAPTTVTA